MYLHRLSSLILSGTNIQGLRFVLCNGHLSKFVYRCIIRWNSYSLHKSIRPFFEILFVNLRSACLSGTSCLLLSNTRASHQSRKALEATLHKSAVKSIQHIENRKPINAYLKISRVHNITTYHINTSDTHQINNDGIIACIQH